MQPSNTLNPLPVALKARRTTRRRPRFQPRRSRQTKQPKLDEEDQVFASLPIISDTRVALRVIREDWSEAANQDLPRTPPLVLRSQVTALVANKSEIHRELDAACSEGLRRIVLPGGSDCFITPEDFEARAQHSESPVLQKFFNEVFKQNHLPWLSLSSLQQVYAEHTDDAIDELVRNGYLTSVDEHSYNFCFPGMGMFMKNREAGAKHILSILKRTPYKEMVLTKLQLRTLKDTCFTARWHVRDVVGSGQAECVDTSVGVLVRLVI
ncbi:Serine/threonine-protein kinase 19 [Gracilariopsis chorda]|uniref:Serine/threonine-protein kinase 19 n=1 Tax=Gracilariopsis chorda TaxID=448386 RepID=A0A2V3IR59_9FLOR|nr:Serine/threonine-protein kinase 19 [Gracilariopsis chorda]|eukprot:PXF44584.1 Serine/threonine-protein kinase 19 [Gracilariopsis chorda]